MVRESQQWLVSQYLPLILILCLVTGIVLYCTAYRRWGAFFEASFAGLKWFALCYVPVFTFLMVAIGVMMYFATGGYMPWDLWPVQAILCVPAAGLVAAGMSIPPPNRHM